MIEPAHLAALFDENEITIAEAEAAGSRSTAAAYAAQQETIRRVNRAPAVSWPAEAIEIYGFQFSRCPVPGCGILTDSAPCPVHQQQGGTNDEQYLG